MMYDDFCLEEALEQNDYLGAIDGLAEICWYQKTEQSKKFWDELISIRFDWEIGVYTNWRHYDSKELELKVLDVASRIEEYMGGAL